MMSVFLKSILLALLALSASFAFARLPREIFEPDTEVGFYRRETLPKLPAGGLERALTASVRLQDKDEGGSCSGVVISEDGHVLTAAHCVIGCLGKNEVLSGFRSQYVSYFQPKSLPLNVECNIAVEELKAEKGRVVYMGPLLMLSYGAFPHFSEQTKAKIVDLAKSDEDVAVIKYEVATKQTCLPLAKVAPKEGDYVWAIGFPGRTLRRNGFDSQGKGTEHVSYGKVLKDINPALIPIPAMKDAIRYVRALGGDMHLVSDMDIFSGNSGGLWMNDKAELVGVSSAIFCPPIEDVDVNSCLVDYHAGNAFGENALASYRNMQKRLGQANAAKFFACPN